MLTLSAIIPGQFCACIWQFFIAPLESWVTLLTGGSNNIGWDQSQAKPHLYKHICTYIESYKTQISMKTGKFWCMYICLQLVYAFKCMYTWLHIAIYTHICSIQMLKRCPRPLYSAFTPRKLVCATPSWHSYGAAPPNFYAEGCSSNPATRTCR